MLLTVDSTGEKIPGNTQGTRRKLVFRNTGANTVYWGFEIGTSAVGPSQGVPLAANEGMVIDGINSINKPVYFVSPTGSTINWTELA